MEYPSEILSSHYQPDLDPLMTPSLQCVHPHEFSADPDLHQQSWIALERSIDKLFAFPINPTLRNEEKPSCEEFMMLYTGIYDLLCVDREVSDKFATIVYDKYIQLIDNCIQVIIESGVEIVQSCKGEEGIAKFSELWNSFSCRMKRLVHSFNYLERYFILRQNLTPLWELAINRFDDQVFQKVRGQLQDEFVTLLERRREGQPVNESLLSEVVALFLQIHSSKTRNNFEDLEEFVFEKAVDYYSSKASEWELNMDEKQVHQALEYEKEFAEKCFPKQTVVKLEERLKKAFLQEKRMDKKKQILKKGVQVALSSCKKRVASQPCKSNLMAEKSKILIDPKA